MCPTAAIRTVGRDARCFRALRLWEHHVGTCRLLRAWLAVGRAAQQRRRALVAQAFRRWSVECRERERVREALRQILYRLSNRLAGAVVRTWCAAVVAAKDRRGRGAELAQRAILRAQALILARALQTWVEQSWEGRAVRHLLRVGWRMWQLQRHQAAIRRRLQEQIERVRRQSVSSVVYHWRQHTCHSIAARMLQAAVRGLAARRLLSRIRAATDRLQRYWRKWMDRRRIRLLASAISRLRFRELSGAWQGWHLAVHRLQNLRKTLAKAVARWQQKSLAEALSTWLATYRESVALRDTARQAIGKLLQAQLSRAWLQWVWTVQKDGRLRDTWRTWRHSTQLARLSRSQFELNAVLVIQSFVRRDRRSRHATQERAAATVLQALVRSSLMERHGTGNAPVDAISIESPSGVLQWDNNASVGSDVATVASYTPVAQTRELEAQRRAAQAASQAQTLTVVASTKEDSLLDRSASGVDPDDLQSLKTKYRELKRILKKLETGDKLHMHRPSGHDHATVWVELELQQVRWDFRGHQQSSSISISSSSSSRSSRSSSSSSSRASTRAEHGKAFSSIRRVCWGTGSSPLLKDLRVRDPELCFSCECEGGVWLDFEASEAAQLRHWVLGLQALVSKPGVQLIEPAKLDWVLQQTRAATSMQEPPRDPAPASTIPSIDRRDFDINQYLSESFDSVLAPQGTGYALVSALVDEIVLKLACTTCSADQGQRIGREDLRALERIRQALVCDYLARDRVHISFTQLVQMLTSDTDAETARLYSSLSGSSLCSAPHNSAWDADSAALAAAGLRMGAQCVIPLLPHETQLPLLPPPMAPTLLVAHFD